MIRERVEFRLLATLASVLVGSEKHGRGLSRRRETKICWVDAGGPGRKKSDMQFDIWVLRNLGCERRGQGNTSGVKWCGEDDRLVTLTALTARKSPGLS